MTIRSEIRALLCVTTMAGLMSSCTTSKGPSRFVQICLMDEAGVGEFHTSIRRLAARNNMRLSDQSERVKSELELVSNKTNSSMPVRDVIHLALERDDTLHIVAGNVGLTNYQVSVSFFEKESSRDATRIADEFLKEVRARWRTVDIPLDEGAKAIPDCP